MDYKEAGVDRHKADSWIRSHSKDFQSNYRPEVLSQLGGFGAFFEAPKNYQDPVFCATTDGVGTKIELAEELGDGAFFGIGVDLVAMCANDLLVCRAEPLVFLDYLATGRLDEARGSSFIKGVVEGCRQAGASLVGGETAEMPGFYSANRMDVAGFCVGVAERMLVQSAPSVEEGDQIVGFPSSGFHSNGFSLIRKVLEKKSIDWTRDETLREALLRPTKIYVREHLELMQSSEVRAAVHITGGGIVENLPRALPEVLCAEINCRSWEVPQLMQEFADWAELDPVEAYSTWNMGIGLCLIGGPGLSSISGAIPIGVIKKRQNQDGSVKLNF